MILGIKHPRHLSILFVILYKLELKVDAHFSKDNVLRIIKYPMITDTSKEKCIDMLMNVRKHYDIETFTWALDASYYILDKVINKIYDDEELIEAVTNICEKYDDMDSVDFDEINTAVKDILYKRDWIDEDGYITPYLIHYANQRHTIFTILETCKDVKDWMKTKEFKDLVSI